MTDARPLSGTVGLAAYIGAPGTGKTTAALEDARATAQLEGLPLVVVDSLASCSDAGELETKCDRTTLARLLVAVVARRESVRWCPTGKRAAAALNAFVGALAASKRGAVVLVDEWSLWINARRRGAPALLVNARTWRHTGLRMLLTSQYVVDMPPELVSCCPRLHVFRLAGARALAAAAALGADPGQVARLTDYSCLEIETGGIATYRPPRRLRARAKGRT